MVYDRERWRATVENGKIPPKLLAFIWPEQYDADLGGPARMHPEAAKAMGAMLRQAWENGHTGLKVVYSYRTYAKQLEKYARYKAGTGNLAATPGTSNHGWAVACDMGWRYSREWEWLKANAAKYGFLFDVPSENWHITYQENNAWIRRGGPELTEDERQMLNWLEGFKKGATENLPGQDSGLSVGQRTAKAIEHSQAGHLGKKHTHKDPQGGATGPAIEP